MKNSTLTKLVVVSLVFAAVSLGFSLVSFLKNNEANNGFETGVYLIDSTNEEREVDTRTETFIMDGEPEIIYPEGLSSNEIHELH